MFAYMHGGGAGQRGTFGQEAACAAHQRGDIQIHAYIHMYIVTETPAGISASPLR